MTTLTGRIRKHPRGFGFLIPDDSASSKDRIYLTPEGLDGILQGDQVKVRTYPGREGLGPRADILEVLRRGQTHCIGRLKQVKGSWWVMRSEEDPDPDLLLQGSQKNLREGTLVLARITEYPHRNHPLLGEIAQELSSAGADEAKLDVLRCSVEAGWPMEFAPETERETRDIKFDTALPSWRTDCRMLPFVTIDGEDAKDFDDAVAAVEDPQSGNTKVYVAIADVSHYVRTNSSVDTDAFARATSVYFPGTVSPMLPEALSNHLCSLVPNEDREVMVCEMHFDKQAKRGRMKFYPGRIRSQKRCTYGEVETFRQSGRLDQATPAVVQSLKLLFGLYEKLKSQRVERGALDFELPESRVYVDAQGTPTQIVKEARYESHRLIEEWMIAANRAAAEFLDKAFGAAVYRNHDFPDAKKSMTFLQLAKTYFPREAPTLEVLQKSPKGLQGFLDKISDSPRQELFQYLALRSLPQAVYESALKGHYGLGLTHYTHFTSPIRRYPDLIAHRMIKTALSFVPDDVKDDPVPESHPLPQANSHCSTQERAAMELERRVGDIKRARFMRAYIGEAFSGRITGVTRSGLFVRLHAFPVDGMVPIETLPRDDYRFEETAQAILGRDKKNQFHLGDEMLVTCVQADPELGRVTYEMIYQ